MDIDSVKKIDWEETVRRAAKAGERLRIFLFLWPALRVSFQRAYEKRERDVEQWRVDLPVL